MTTVEPLPPVLFPSCASNPAVPVLAKRAGATRWRRRALERNPVEERFPIAGRAAIALEEEASSTTTFGITWSRLSKLPVVEASVLASEVRCRVTSELKGFMPPLPPPAVPPGPSSGFPLVENVPTLP